MFTTQGVLCSETNKLKTAHQVKGKRMTENKHSGVGRIGDTYLGCSTEGGGERRDTKGGWTCGGKVIHDKN